MGFQLPGNNFELGVRAILSTNRTPNRGEQVEYTRALERTIETPTAPDKKSSYFPLLWYSF